MEEASGGGAAAASPSPTRSGIEGPTPTGSQLHQLPLRRAVAQEAPYHGTDSPNFTIEVHHGGCFLGQGLNLSYMDEKIAWFDNFHKDTFENCLIDYMISQLGYPKDQLEHVFWCPPGRTLSQMYPILLEKDCAMMAKASVENKVLVVFLQHVKKRKKKLPKVLVSPLSKEKIRKIKSEKEQKSEKKKDVEEGNNAQKSDSENSEISEEYEDDSDIDPAWYDSDYNLGEDDDLYAENVDDTEEDEMVEKGKKKAAEHALVPGSDDVIEDDLHLPVEDDNERRHKSDSDDEEYKKKKKKEQVIYKYKTFNSYGDMEDPQFKLGMVFESVQQLRKAIAQYAVKNRVQIKKSRNNAKRLEAHCSEGCPWKMIAVKDNRTISFLVKFFIGEHTCEKVWDVKELTAPFLAKKYVEMFRDNDRMTLQTFARKVRKKYNMEPSRHKLGRARKAALAVVHGDEIKQYSLLWQYGQELRTRNPGSSFYLNLENGMFSTCYFSLAACKVGWLKGCRLIICLDGTFIKTKYGGQLLTAVGIDGNDSIYPIAMAIVETECHSSWSWFLATLKQDLNIRNTSAITIMSDKQKGLIKAVQEQFPHSEHRFCVMHLYQNIHQLHKGETVRQQVWACAKSTTTSTFDRNMVGLKEDNPGAHAFVEEMAPSTWCRAFFDEFPKCDILLNNTCEVFNRYILDARELPVMSMWEKIRSQLMHRHYSKKKEAIQKWSGKITPKAREKLRKNTEFAANCQVETSGMGVFGVLSNERNYVLVAESERIPPESLVSSCYSLETYMEAYGGQIFPLRDKDDWAHVDATPIIPPLYEKVAGRRKKNRRKQPEESADGTRLSKHGAIMHCGYCRVAGHNRGGCAQLKAAILRENGVAGGHGAEHHATQQHAAEEAAEQHVGEEHAAVEEHGAEQDAAEHHIGEEHAAAKEHAVAQKGKSSRGRKIKPSTKVKEQVEQLMQMAKRKKSKSVIDENGDVDYPVILTHIQNRPIRPQLDPENQKNCMVHILQREGPARSAPVMVHPIPEENAFVARHRATMSAPRCLVVNTAGRALGRGGAARGRGRRGAARGGVTGGAATRTRGARAKGPVKQKINKNKTRGMEWLLFEENSWNTQARAGQEKEHEKQSTQGAPGCDD